MVCVVPRGAGAYNHVPDAGLVLPQDAAPAVVRCQKPENQKADAGCRRAHDPFPIRSRAGTSSGGTVQEWSADGNAQGDDSSSAECARAASGESENSRGCRGGERVIVRAEKAASDGQVDVRSTKGMGQAPSRGKAASAAPRPLFGAGLTSPSYRRLLDRIER